MVGHAQFLGNAALVLKVQWPPLAGQIVKDSVALGFANAFLGNALQNRKGVGAVFCWHGLLVFGILGQ